MVDVKNLAGFLRVFDSYYIITQDFPTLRGKGIKRAAIVDREISGLREWFIETAAVNRGYNLRVFFDRKTALEWLHGTDPHGSN